MGLFRHPHLTRGVVHTPMGAFTVNRGIVDLPDDLGESLGWEPVMAEGWGIAEDANGDPRAQSAHIGRAMAERAAPR
jgi:hypothetical protein